MRSSSRGIAGITAASCLLLMGILVMVAGITAPQGRDGAGLARVAARREAQQEWSRPAGVGATPVPIALTGSPS